MKRSFARTCGAVLHGQGTEPDVRNAHIPHPFGFTLVELLVTLVVLALLLSMVYGVLVSSLMARKEVEGSLSTAEAAQTIANLIAQDLRGALFYGVDPQYTLVGEDSDGDPQVDSIYFTTTADSLMLRRFADNCVVSYTATDSGGLVTLERSEMRYPPDENSTPAISEVSDRLTFFDVKYLPPDSDEWQDEWVSATGASGENAGSIKAKMGGTSSPASTRPESNSTDQEGTEEPEIISPRAIMVSFGIVPSPSIDEQGESLEELKKHEVRCQFVVPLMAWDGAQVGSTVEKNLKDLLSKNSERDKKKSAVDIRSRIEAQRKALRNRAQRGRR